MSVLRAAFGGRAAHVDDDADLRCGRLRGELWDLLHNLQGESESAGSSTHRSALLPALGRAVRGSTGTGTRTVDAWGLVPETTVRYNRQARGRPSQGQSRRHGLERPASKIRANAT